MKQQEVTNSVVLRSLPQPPSEDPPTHILLSTSKKKANDEETAELQLRQLNEYLFSYLEEAKISGVSEARTNAREKLTKLSKQQFNELSTDVFDEMKRRAVQKGGDGKASDSTPFLPLQEAFHPKRNQARQKLATLPEERYKDLASDVYVELGRRYPTGKAVVETENAKKHVSTLKKDDRPMSPPAGFTPPPKPPKEAVALAINAANVALEKSTAKTVATAAAAAIAAKALSQVQNTTPTPVLPTSPPAIAPKVLPKRDKTPEITVEVDSEFTSLNFDSLDTLMADLGSMISPGASRSHSATTLGSVSSDGTLAPLSKATSLDFKRQSTLSILAVESAAASVQVDELVQTLRSQHIAELELQSSKHAQKVATLEAEIKEKNAQYEARIAALEDELRRSRETQTETYKSEEALRNQMDQNQKLLQQIASLELTVRQNDERVRALTQQLDDSKDAMEALSLSNQSLRQESDAAAAKHRAVVEELSASLLEREQAVELKVREARSLLDEKNNVEMERNETQVENIALKEEIRTLKEQIASLKNSLRTSGGSSTPAHPTLSRGGSSPLMLQRASTNPSFIVSITEEMVFDDGISIKDLVNGIKELIGAVQRNVPADILMAMKSIVMTVRKHLDDAEEFEKSSKSELKPHSKEKLDALQNEISDKLTALVVLAKGRASSDDSSDEVVAQVETVATSLSYVVFKLLTLLNGGDGDVRNEFAVDDLKAFLDQQTNVIVQSIQTLLLVLKQHARADGDFMTSLDSIVTAVTRFKKVVSYSINMPSQRPNEIVMARVDNVLQSLSTVIASMLEIRQTVQRTGQRPANQVVAGLAYAVAQYTKELVTILG